MPRVIITTLADANTAEILADLFDRAGQVVADKFNARFETMYDRLAE
jgi:toxin ParE1/3/4